MVGARKPQGAAQGGGFMNPKVIHAQRACEAAKARQAIVVWFDEHGQFAVASYGETKAE